MKKLLFVLLIAVIGLSQAFAADEIERESLNVTVYNNYLGVIKDIRILDLKKGISDIKITDVASKIDPTSVHIDFNGSVIEQNYQYDLVRMKKILDKYIDKEITLTNNERVITGILLSSGRDYQYEMTLRTKDGSIIMIPNYKEYQITTGKLPEGLITKPTLLWTIDSKTSGKQHVGISYQTSGMSWHTEYIAVLNEGDTKADIKAWVSITNKSGATYEKAKLKLVAGEVNRVQFLGYREKNKQNRVLSVAASPDPQFKEKEFFAYHIYNLQRKTTLRNNETKQISLFEAEDVKIKKKFKHVGSSENVSVFVEFKNSKKNNLGMPMPAGKVRFNKSDGDNLEFIGEDMIAHTPKDENIELKLGDAFDIKAEYKIMGQQNLSNKVSIKKVEIKFKNRSKKDVVIEAERYFYGEWEVSKNNFDFEKKDYQTAIFKVKVDKDEEVILKYTVRTTTP